VILLPDMVTTNFPLPTTVAVPFTTVAVFSSTSILLCIKFPPFKVVRYWFFVCTAPVALTTINLSSNIFASESVFTAVSQLKISFDNCKISASGLVCAKTQRVKISSAIVISFFIFLKILL